jgi:hypothetical protein
VRSVRIAASSSVGSVVPERADAGGPKNPTIRRSRPSGVELNEVLM